MTQTVIRKPELASTDADQTGTAMLLIHEALARSRMSEAEQAARAYRTARTLTAGRNWGRLARFAQRRSERARSARVVALGA
jgi:hypothetical protein